MGINYGFLYIEFPFNLVSLWFCMAFPWFSHENLHGSWGFGWDFPFRTPGRFQVEGAGPERQSPGAQGRGQGTVLGDYTYMGM